VVGCEVGCAVAAGVVGEPLVVDVVSGVPPCPLVPPHPTSTTPVARATRIRVVMRLRSIRKIYATGGHAP
jgi:hypothetical protein